jgi:hypothetical protein
VTARPIIALGLALLVAVAPLARAGGAPEEGTAPVSEGAQYGRVDAAPGGTPSAGQKVYDAVVLRPFGFVQAVVSAAVFVVLYPVALVTGTTTDLTEMCITGPVEQTFRRPLGAP